MVFKDFDRARAEAIIAVNDFLKKTWGIEDYTRLAPAALLFRVPGYKGFHAFPLLLEDVDDRGWTASVFGESVLSPPIMYCLHSPVSSDVGYIQNDIV